MLVCGCLLNCVVCTWWLDCRLNWVAVVCTCMCVRGSAALLADELGESWLNPCVFIEDGTLVAVGADIAAWLDAPADTMPSSGACRLLQCPISQVSPGALCRRLHLAPS